MSTTTALSEADQRLLRLLATAENELPADIDTAKLGRFRGVVDELQDLTSEAQHERLVLRAHDLVALLSPEPSFPSNMHGITTRAPAFLAPLAVAARDGRLVSGPPLGVWVGAQRPALAPGAWATAEQELKDLVGLTALPVVPSVGRGALTMPYQPLAKTNRITQVTRTDLPAVAVKPVPGALRSFADDAVRELEAYTRTLESFEELSFAIRAARLPRALFELWMRQPAGLRLVRRVEQLLRRPSVQMHDLLTMLLPDVDAPDRRHIGAVSELLQRFGIGFEPDPRFLAPLPRPETRLDLFEWRLTAEAPSEGFLSASGLLHIGLAMAGADGHVAPAEIEHMRRRAMTLVSHEDERRRLALRAEALAANPPDFERLLQRLKALRPAAKQVVADLLVGVASTDGHVSAAEYEALQRAFRAMRLGKPALDRTLEELRGDVRLADAVGADRDRRSSLGQEQDAKRFDALRDLLLGTAQPEQAK